MVAEVEVDQATGGVTVKRLVVAQDCGPISNPDGMRNQIEGGALQGLSRALGEEVTWDDQQGDVDRLADLPQPAARVRRAGDRERADQPAGVEASGAGETAITIVAAAVGNAIFDATGARMREVPFTAERIAAALGAR